MHVGYQYRSILKCFIICYSTNVRIPVSVDTGTFLCTSIGRYWNIVCVPVSVDTIPRPFYVFQYRAVLKRFMSASIDTGMLFPVTVSVDTGTFRSILEHFCVPVSVDTRPITFSSIGRY